MRASLALVVSGLLIGGVVFAHPGHDHGPGLHVWKSADGLTEFEASLVMLRDGQVKLCQPDGTLVWVPLANLSPAGQAFASATVEAVRTINAPKHEMSSDDMAGGSLTSSTLPIRWKPVFSACIVFGVMALAAATGLMTRRKTRAFPVTVCLLGAAGSLTTLTALAQGERGTPAIQKHFEPFKSTLELRTDDEFLYVGSNGFPDHPMMIGIKAWQQQVPVPQPYTGRNAWRIPLKPKLADKPISAKTALFRGAIALAVNGVPIFNALNNRGEDAYLAGELDEYGGHCGRGDDYHYHIAPVHLEKTIGKGNPIAYALDGFPIYGYSDADGKTPTDLDEFNGRMEKDGYRYYSTKKFPYINGGMRGVVTVRGDQIDPQPRDAPFRPAGQPLRGATITGFTREDDKKTYTLQYEVRGKKLSWRYTFKKDDTCTFVYTDAAGNETTETYRRRERKDKDGQPPKKDGPPPKKDAPPPKKNEQPEPVPAKSGTFKLSSPAFEAVGKFPIEFTGDGDGVSPPLSWSGAPQETKCYALQLWHVPGPGEVKSYWVLYDIPAGVSRLEKNTKGVGKNGYNDKNRTDYDPMKSKGPGLKEYHITIYALSAEPKFTGEKVNRADLLAAIKNITVAESTLSYKYERMPK